MRVLGCSLARKRVVVDTTLARLSRVKASHRQNCLRRKVGDTMAEKPKGGSMSAYIALEELYIAYGERFVCGTCGEEEFTDADTCNGDFHS